MRCCEWIPTIAYDYTNLAGGYIALNRFDDSKAALEKALAQKLDWVGTYGELYRLALQRGNTKAAQQYAEKPKAYPLERPNSYYPIMNLVSQCKLHEANRSNGTLRQPGATNLQDALPGLGHSGL